ncbi:MAG: DNA primase [Pyrinomonadaceae bacterium]
MSLFLVLYDQYFIDDLKERADLVRIIEPYAPLKKKGSNWMGCCPFHQEKTPSFSVSPTKGFYNCFGCGKGGNAYTFLMEMEGLNFPEAIQRVAEMSGVPLPEPIDDRQYEKNKKRKEEKKQLSDQVIELNKFALDFWEAELQAKNPKGKAAREYLESRGISDEIQKQFHVGFSPDSWDSLLNHLRESGADEKLIEQSGLVSVNEEKDRVFDRFRGRIMFPVLDVNGNAIAFGARAMGDDQPKYLNSPETPAYVKGQHLYGLFQSREEIRRKKFVILVEGYLDLIALYQFGITNVAASLGTAFTPEQSKLLSRFATKVVINYDGDAAGIKAARKAVDSLLADDFDIKILVLPDGKDPDDFIRQHGPETYDELRGKAQPFLDFALDTAIKGRRLNIAKQKADAIEEVLPMLSVVRNPIQKRESFDQAMDFFRVENAALRRDLWKTVKQSGHVGSSSIKQQIKRATQIKLTVAEQQLLELLINDSELRERILPQLEETDYEDLATADVFRALYELDKEKVPVTLENIIPFVAEDETAADFVPLLMMTEPKREPGEVIDTVLHNAEERVVALRLMAINTRIAGISQDALAAEQSGQLELHSRLTFEQLELEKIKRSLLNQIRES